MAAGSRSRRAEVDASSLNNLERLILCQAVYEYGSNAWPEVAQVLSAHPMISRPKMFTAQVSSSHFVVVVRVAEVSLYLDMFRDLYSAYGRCSAGMVSD